jgi:hypothetical protein
MGSAAQRTLVEVIKEIARCLTCQAAPG